MLEDYLEEEEEQQQQQQPASAVASHNKQCPAKSTHCSAVCVLVAKERAQCARCDVGLCMVPCFTEYHTNVNF